MPPIGKQDYRASDTFSPATAAITPDYRAQVAAASITPCKAGKLVAAGYLEDGQSFVAFANNKGNSGYQRSTGLDYTCTVRTEDGRGSGWVGHNVQDASSFDAGTDIRTAMRKASASVDAKAIEPGKYTVILEPAAAAGLISFMMNFFDARSADEAAASCRRRAAATRSANRCSGRRSIFPPTPGPRCRRASLGQWRLSAAPEDADHHRRQGPEPGIFALLGAETGQAAGGGTGQSVDGGRHQVDRRAGPHHRARHLVSRTWYIRMVDPQTVLLTGLTRDGTFYIENGEIKYPIKNLRFNESPVIMLNNIDELGKPVRVAGDESSLVMVLPPMRLRDFTFTSLSDAV